MGEDYVGDLFTMKRHLEDLIGTLNPTDRKAVDLFHDAKNAVERTLDYLDPDWICRFYTESGELK